MSLRSTPEEQAAMLKKSENRYLADPQAGLELLASLITPPDENKFDKKQKQARTILVELQRLIDEDFTELCKQDNLPNEAEMHGKLNEAIEELTELVNFSALANKTVVGIGGGFSAGKSSFINSLLGNNNLLPNSVTPTTAIPTYLAQGAKEDIRAINIFGNAVPVDKEAVNALCHDFYVKYNVQPKYFINTLNITTPDFPYKYLAFVDTPGYSNDNGEVISDRQVALNHLRLAKVLVWVVDIANGTLRQSDMEFIQEARAMDEAESFPIFVILNKADSKSADELQEVIGEVMSNLENARIECNGIVAYDSTIGKELAKAGESINEYLEKVSCESKPCRLTGRFAQVFDAYTAHNKAEEVKLREHLRFFVKFAVDREGKLSTEEKNSLGEFIKTQKNKISPLSGLVIQFEKLGHKAELLVKSILDNLKVEDENPEAMGITGECKIREEQIFVKLLKGEKRAGTVKAVTKGIGVSIDCGFEIMLDDKDVLKHLAQFPKVGTVCSVQILRISSKGDVKVVVTFNDGGLK